MSVREIANIGADSLFGYVKIGLMIVFVAVVFATIFATLKRVDVDIVEIAKQIITGKKEKNAAYIKGVKAGLEHYTAKPSSQPCENGMCSRKINAPDHGTLVRNPTDGVRLIVCAECAPAYVKTGWIPEMSWGEEFKSAAIGILVGAATRNIGIPKTIFTGLARPYSRDFTFFLMDFGFAVLLAVCAYVGFSLLRERDREGV